MLKLLRANFRLLLKSKMFYIALAANIVMSVFAVLSSTDFSNNILVVFLVMMPTVCTAHTALFVGKEYSDGTLRSKLIYGHTRGKVYFSYLITCVAANLILIVPGMVIVVVSRLDFFTLFDTKALLLITSGYLIANVVLCSLFVAVGFNFSSKAVSTVIAVLIVIVGYFSITFIAEGLSQPEVRYTVIVGDDNEIKQKIPDLNPDYIGEPARTVLNLVYNFMPHGQINEYYNCFDSVYDSWYTVKNWMEETDKDVYDWMKRLNVYVFNSKYIKEAEEIQRDFEYVFLVNQLALIGASAFFGLQFFKKKNLK